MSGGVLREVRGRRGRLSSAAARYWKCYCVEESECTNEQDVVAADPAGALHHKCREENERAKARQRSFDGEEKGEESVACREDGRSDEEGDWTVGRLDGGLKSEEQSEDEIPSQRHRPPRRRQEFSPNIYPRLRRKTATSSSAVAGPVLEGNLLGGDRAYPCYFGDSEDSSDIALCRGPLQHSSFGRVSLPRAYTTFLFPSSPVAREAEEEPSRPLDLVKDSLNSPSLTSGSGNLPALKSPISPLPQPLRRVLGFCEARSVTPDSAASDPSIHPPAYPGQLTYPYRSKDSPPPQASPTAHSPRDQNPASSPARRRAGDCPGGSLLHGVALPVLNPTWSPESPLGIPASCAFLTEFARPPRCRFSRDGWKPPPIIASGLGRQGYASSAISPRGPPLYRGNHSEIKRHAQLGRGVPPLLDFSTDSWVGTDLSHMDKSIDEHQVPQRSGK
ncbi:hypothetical protein JHW43_008788 [Diplocarpon mali]|nr:hypothetical protein JHW43_008788 [Diplocarpon mali]